MSDLLGPDGQPIGPSSQDLEQAVRLVDRKINKIVQVLQPMDTALAEINILLEWLINQLNEQDIELDMEEWQQFAETRFKEMAEKRDKLQAEQQAQTQQGPQIRWEE